MSHTNGELSPSELMEMTGRCPECGTERTLREFRKRRVVKDRADSRTRTFANIALERSPRLEYIRPDLALERYVSTMFPELEKHSD